MRISCFVTGRVRRKRAPRGVRRYVVDEWADETLPVNVFLVEHPRGLLLFDTGQTARATEARYFPRWYPFFRLSRFELGRDDEVAARLRQSGRMPSDVRWVALSHLHTDHVGGIDAFPAAEILVSRTEWADAQGVAGRLRGYLPQYWPADIKPTLVDFDGPPVGPFGGSHDIAGDAALVLVPSPGHTRGHMSLLVRGGQRSFLLGGDAVLSAAELGEGAPEVAAFCATEGVTFLASHDENAPQLLEVAESPQA